MAVSASITPGAVVTENDNITVSLLNQIANPTVDISGSVSSLAIGNNAINDANVNSTAGIQFSKMEQTLSGRIVVGDDLNQAKVVQLSGDGGITYNTSTGNADLTISAAAVDTGKISDDAVTTAKIGDGQVTAAKLASGINTIPTGSITAYIGATAPSGWLLCDGTEIASSETALESVLNGTYGTGSNGRSLVPDLRGRVPVGVDGAAARLTSNDTLGSSGGTETHTLTEAEMPSHSHTYERYDHSDDGSSLSVGGHSNAGTTATSVSSTGSDQAHNNMQPYLVTNWIIRT